MASRLAAAGLLAVGVLLMANPLYLPVTVGDPDPAYTHTVQPVQSGSSVGDPGIDAESLSDDDVVDYGDLSPGAREAFDRAREAEGGFGVGDPAARVDPLSYPAEPTLGDGLVIVEPGDVQSFFADLDVEAVHGVGPVTAAEMREMGIETAGELAAADPARLAAAFGERGRRVHRFARGEDDRDVEPKGRPKSFSRESAFTEATADPERHHDRLRTLAEAVAERADQRGVLYRTIGIKVVEPPFDIRTRAESLSGPVADDGLVVDVATQLFEEFAGEEIRKLGVRVSNLSFGSERQPSLAAWSDESAAVNGDTADDGDRERHEGQSSLQDFR